MEKVETYEIVKKQMEGNPIKLDGKYFSAITDLMREKFQNQRNCEERVKKLRNNAIEIFKKIRVIKNTNGIHRNLLLVGKVQSGKTSNMQMAIALAFDNGYNSAVLYGGYDAVLLEQTINRFKDEAFKKPNSMSEDDAKLEWVNIISTRKTDSYCVTSLDADAIKDIFESGGKIIFICMKRSRCHIDALNKFFESLEDVELNPIIFDDEGDQASLNNLFRKGKMSTTYDSIVKMKKILHNPPYLSVTATPYALVFQDKISYLIPKDLQLIYPGDGYTGLNSFHSINFNKTIYIKDEMDNALSTGRIPDSLFMALYTFIVSTALLRNNQIMDKAQMLIHFDKHVSEHNEVYKLIDGHFNSFKRVIENNQSSTLEKKLSSLEIVFNDDKLIEPSIKKNLNFSDIKKDVVHVLKKVFVCMQNGIGKEEMKKLDRKKYQIRIGADLMQRGVSFDNLITTYFTRWPSGTSNMDTQTQRARWLGYRIKYFDYCKIFTTPEIAFSFSSLQESEDDLWNQMAEVNSGYKQIKEIVIPIDSSDNVKFIPSRKSASNFEMKTFGRKWLNQFYGISDPLVAEKNNNIIEGIYNKYANKLKPTCAGSLTNTPTAWHCKIGKNDFVNLINNSINIFNSHPFDGVRKILKMTQNFDIDIEFFWNPEKVNIKQRQFGKDKRTRTFVKTAEGFRISALQQGANTNDDTKLKYRGDSYVIADEKCVTIQVFPMFPLCNDGDDLPIKNVFQYMFSIHSPKVISVFEKGEDI